VLGKEIFKKNVLLFAERRLETLGKEGVTVHNGHDRRFSLPKAPVALGKGFAERPTKDARQRSLCRTFLCREVTLGKGFAERKSLFAERPRRSANPRSAVVHY